MSGLSTTFRKNIRSIDDFRPSLSTYFPDGTVYFYGYPSGEESGFINKVPPAVEELVAARTACCNGSKVSVITFDATTTEYVPADILQKLNIPQPDAFHHIVLPKNIGVDLAGSDRNNAVRQALLDRVEPKELVMAQPFTEPELEPLYQIPSSLSLWMNDKSNMREYVQANMLPATLGTFDSGDACNAALPDLALPYVIKVTSSSSGDGVYICTTPENVSAAIEDLNGLQASILIEQYIETSRNFAVHFGIPHDENREVDILGVNEQITTDDGAFLGGIITDEATPDGLEAAINHLKQDILPFIRTKGWYGVGGFDVLLDHDGQAYFIDCNFRMTGMSAYHFMVLAGRITRPMVSFTGQINGSQQQFEDIIMPLAGKHAATRCIQIISISHHDDTWLFNAALQLDPQQPVKDQIDAVLQAGIVSEGLQKLRAVQ